MMRDRDRNREREQDGCSPLWSMSFVIPFARSDRTILKSIHFVCSSNSCRRHLSFGLKHFPTLLFAPLSTTFPLDPAFKFIFPNGKLHD